MKRRKWLRWWLPGKQLQPPVPPASSTTSLPISPCRSFSVGFTCACLGRCPDCQAECNLVDKVCKIVHEVENAVLDATHQVSEEVAKGVDGPTNCHDETHGLEGLLHVLVHAARGCQLSGFTCEDLEQDVAPARHTKHEAREWVDNLGFAGVAEGQHRDGADHQAPEHATTEGGLNSQENQVELDHLQGDGNRPIDVAVEDRRPMHDDPILSHVEVVHSCNQGDQSANVHGCLPVVAHNHRLHQEEDSCCHHRNGDDPEGDGNGITRVEEAMVISHFGENQSPESARDNTSKPNLDKLEPPC